MANVKSGAVSALRTWVEEQLATAAPGSAFPPDRQLAKEWGLSARTVARVMTGYAAGHRVVRIPGKGTFVPGGTGVKPASDMAPPRRGMADHLKRSIVHGELRAGDALPSVKYMARRFRTSRAAVIAAYRGLIADGLVTKVGRTFWVGRFRDLLHPQPGREVLLLVRDKAELRKVFSPGEFVSAAYRKLEQTLSTAGFMLRCDFLENLPAQYRNWRRSRRFPYGLGSRRLETSPPETAGIMFRTMRHPMPTVVDWEAGVHPHMFNATCVFSRSNTATTVARELAAYLVRLGCRSACFFMEEATRGDRLAVFYDYLRMRAELKHRNASFDLSLAVLGSLQTVLANIHEVNASNLLSKYARTTLNAIGPEVRGFRSRGAAFAHARRAEVWIFRDSRVAAAALSWAAQQRIRVPADLSILTLDDAPAYYHLGITRCRLDWEAVGYLMAHALIGDFPIEKTTRGYLRVHARVVEKLTTRRV